MDTTAGLAASLAVTGRCNRTGGRYVCIGHVDFFGTYFVWTRHFLKTTDYRIVPYDHPAPEVIHASTLPRQ